jgi:aminoglycoside phosphotransferase (APT) family kinase protein
MSDVGWKGVREVSELHPIPPSAEGVRLEWQDLPERVRAAVEERLGSAVVAAVTQPGGFSPGVAARLQTAHGERVFVKAVGPEPNPDSAACHRREARIVRSLPVTAPIPRLIWSHDEGEDGWVALAFEDLEARHPAQPWRGDELDRVLTALAGMSAALTPSPVLLAEAGSAVDELAENLCGWRALQAERPASLDDWSARHLDALADLEGKAPEAAAGDSLLHFDIRADNLLLTPERVYVVDWALACVGAAWIDVAFFAPSVTMQGGPPPEALLDRCSTCQTADPEAVTAVVAAIAGFFTHRALQPPPPGLPTLRAFQAAQGVVARRWVAERMGWE